jgi:hypothetical protein
MAFLSRAHSIASNLHLAPKRHLPRTRPNAISGLLDNDWPVRLQGLNIHAQGWNIYDCVRRRRESLDGDVIKDTCATYGV